MSSQSQQAWNRLRPLIKELTFSEIKDAAGGGGLPLERIAHLRQASLPAKSATKSELLDAITSLIAEVPESQRIDTLRAFMCQLFRRQPAREDELRRELRRAGFDYNEAGEIVRLEKEKLSALPERVMKPGIIDPAPKLHTPNPSVFVSYCHEDRKFKTELEDHLQPFCDSGTISFWTDSSIEPGAEWFQEIKEALEKAHVAVLLVTKKFLASRFIRDHELAPIRERAARGLVKVLWVPVRACSWKETFLRDLQAASDPDKPLAERGRFRDGDWVRICERIKAALPH